MLHEAHLDAVTHLAPNRVRAQAADSIYVGLKRIGVSVERARIYDGHHAHVAENLVPNRVHPHRRAFLHEELPLILFVFLGIFATLFPPVADLPLRPVYPETIPIPYQDPAGFLLAHTRHLDSGIIGLLEPDPIIGDGDELSLPLPPVLAGPG